MKEDESTLKQEMSVLEEDVTVLKEEMADVKAERYEISIPDFSQISRLLCHFMMIYRQENVPKTLIFIFLMYLTCFLNMNVFPVLCVNTWHQQRPEEAF